MTNTSSKIQHRILFSIVLIAALVGSYYWWPSVWAGPLVAADRMASGLTLHERSIDGRTYVFSQKPGNPVVLMLHGFAGSQDQWNAFVRALPPDLGVIALDMPGFGQSTALPQDSFGIAAQGDRVLAFMRDLGLSQVHLVGSSMGGHVAAYIAASEPQRVRTLTMIEPHGVATAVQTEFDHFIRRTGRSPLIARSGDEFAQIVDRIFVNRPFIPGPVYKRLERSAIYNSSFDVRVWNDVQKEAAALAALMSRVTAPTLLIWGDSQKIFHTTAIQVLQSVRPNLKAVVLKNAGHLAMMEQPDETAAAFTTFIHGGPAADQ